MCIECHEVIRCKKQGVIPRRMFMKSRNKEIILLNLFVAFLFQKKQKLIAGCKNYPHIQVI